MGESLIWLVDGKGIVEVNDTSTTSEALKLALNALMKVHGPLGLRFPPLHLGEPELNLQNVGSTSLAAKVSRVLSLRIVGCSA